jgi:hypothetical protein
VAPELPLTDLFERPTVEALARHLDRDPSEPQQAAGGFRGSRRRVALSRRARSDGWS